MTNYVINRFLRLSPSSNVWTQLLIRGNSSSTSQKLDILSEARRKKPKNALSLFLMDFKAKIGKEELLAKGGFRANALQKWQEISESEKLGYLNEYKRNAEIYYDKLYEIFREIPDLSKLNIYEEKILKKVLKIQQEKHEKPVKPLSDFLLYVKEHRGSIEMDEITESWMKLDSKVKKKYQDIARQNYLDYKEKLELWECKMLKEGHHLLVRKKMKQQYLKNKKD